MTAPGFLAELSPLWLGVLGSLGAGLMTAAGAIPVAFGRSVTERSRDGLLGFAAGVMLAASFFSLIIPALEAAAETYGDGAVPPAIAVGGLVLGVAAMGAMNRYAPHEHFITGREGPQGASLRRIWLFVVAITLHNLPEGLAVGVGFGTGDVSQGATLALGIGLQNAPEGLAVAVALLGEGYSRGRAIWIATLTGLVEPVGGLVGAAAVSVSEPLLPWGLTFAAGAMLYVISHEIIPETHRRGHQGLATAGLTAGLCVMLFLDVWLG